jgi:hypothetical protein
MRLAFALGAALATAAPVSAQAWSPQPWLEDLAQAQAAVHADYANLDWLQQDRGVDLDALFGRAAAAIRQAGSDADARRVFDRIVQRVADGHVEIEWPLSPRQVTPGASATPAPQGAADRLSDPCAALGYNARIATAGIASRLPGYTAVGAKEDGFAAGIVPVEGHRVGAIRIAAFTAEAFPQFCGAAFAALHISPDRPCDDACRDRIESWAYRRMTEGFEAQLRALRAARATTLLIDLTGNGGGSQWAEAAARIVTPVPLRSEARGYVRGAHWAEIWQGLAADLRDAARAKGASAQDRARLARWAQEADAAARDATAPCPQGQACPRTATLGFATGLVGQADPAFAGKEWAPLLFSPAQYPWHAGVWQGPVIVLVDDDTASAAEEFAAVLQDNRAALIMGARTAGAGCGHTNGGTPTRLAHSGAILQLPDCIRYRADGSNEVSGVIPDLLVGLRANDGPAFKAGLVAQKLPEALAEAARQGRRRIAQARQ